MAVHQNDRDAGSRWRIWSVIDELETNGLSSNSKTTLIENDNTRNHDDMTKQVIQVLRNWTQWAGVRGWNTLLNKKSLLHEVEESIVALHFLSEWLEQQRAIQQNDTPVTLVDVCCGKGIFSLLGSYIYSDKTSTHVSSIIMLDRQPDINWDHIIASNESALQEERPTIQCWGGCNLHEIDQIVNKLESIDGSLAMVGIHLCKQLSPACAGVVNTLGPEKVPFLCLAPCCLPRVVRNLSKANNDSMIPNRMHSKSAKEVSFTVPVRIYESIEERQARIEANERRKGAKKRTFADIPCYLCSEIHPIHKCNLLPSDENERLDIFQKAAALNPCWKCGQVGHMRKDCLSTQQASKPSLVSPPTIDLDVASVLQPDDGATTKRKRYISKGPFEQYSELLSTAIQRDNVKVVDVGLVNNSAQHNNPANHDNWNRDRKSIYIVASS